MSSISAFEQHTRNTLAISVLNKFRRWLVGRDKQLSSNRAAVIDKAVAALNGEMDLSDSLSFYLKDSGEINNAVIFQISKVFHKAIGDDPTQKQKFHKTMSRLLSNRAPETLKTSDEKGFEFVRDVIKRSIYIIDDYQPSGGSPDITFVKAKGF